MKSLPYAASIVRTVAGKVIYVADSMCELRPTAVGFPQVSRRCTSASKAEGRQFGPVPDHPTDLH